MADIFEGSEATFTPVAGDYIRAVDDPTGTPISGNFTVTALATLLNTLISSGGSTPPGRLTLETGVPVSTTDQADKTTLYYTPYIGNQIQLYSGTAWETKTFAELSLNMAAFTASKPYDIWVYNNSGTVTLDSTVWTNATTRATALAYQDGRLVKAGATTRLYLGTVYIDSGQKCQDKQASRYLWNYYNRVNKDLYCKDTTDTWTYTTATFRAANNSTVNGVSRFDCIIGVAEDVIVVENNNTTVNASVVWVANGIGIDSTSVNSAQTFGHVVSGNYPNGPAKYMGALAVGYHYIQRLEYSAATGTTTWFGDNGGTMQSGMTATLRG